MTGSLRGATTGAIAGAFGGIVGYGAGVGWSGLARLSVSALGGCASGKAAGGSCRTGARLAVMAQALSLSMEAFTGQTPTLKTAEGEPLVKPNNRLKKQIIEETGKCEICDVIDAKTPNTGVGITTDNMDLVGKPVSWVQKNYPDEIKILAEGESGILSSVSRSIPGFNSASVFHDKAVGYLERGIGFEGTVFGTLFTPGSIPAAFNLQYISLGGRSYEYYIRTINEEE